jgi:hypothetical protein
VCLLHSGLASHSPHFCRGHNTTCLCLLHTKVFRKCLKAYLITTTPRTSSIKGGVGGWGYIARGASTIAADSKKKMFIRSTFKFIICVGNRGSH